MLGATGGFSTKVSSAALEISGAVSANTAVFSGQVSAAGLTLSGIVSGTSGVFTGTVSANVFDGEVIGTTGGFSTKVSAAAAEFTGDVSVAGDLYIDSASPLIELTDTDTGAVSKIDASSGAGSLFIGADTGNASASSKLYLQTDGTSRLILDDTVAQFSADISAVDAYVSSVVINNTANLGKGLRLTAAGAVADLVSLTDAASITIDFNNGQNFIVQLGGNRTLSAPTNCVAGQTGSIYVIQDGTGSRTLAFNSNWKFQGGTAPTMSTGVSAHDRIDYVVYTSTHVQALVCT